MACDGAWSHLKPRQISQAAALFSKATIFFEGTSKFVFRLFFGQPLFSAILFFFNLRKRLRSPESFHAQNLPIPFDQNMSLTFGSYLLVGLTKQYTFNFQIILLEAQM
jgi:hypothetical protein